MEQKHKKIKVHHVLAYSYMVYFVAVLVGMTLAHFLPYQIFADNVQYSNYTGLFCLFLGTLLIFWAQNASRTTHSLRSGHGAIPHEHHFHKGPYKYTRTPTHLGLDLFLLGFAFIFNSLIMVFVAIAVFIIGRKYFVAKQETLLADIYGIEYLKYKKSVQGKI